MVEFLGVGEDAVRRKLEEARQFLDLYMLRHMGPSEEGAHLTRELIDVHEEAVPGTFPDVTRAVVLVKDANQLALWGALLTGTNPRLGRPVLLRRHERRSLHCWAQLGDMFHTGGRLDRLPELTGGWPLLVGSAGHIACTANWATPTRCCAVWPACAPTRPRPALSPRRPVCTRTRCSRPDARLWADEFEEGTFDREGAVTAIAVRIEDGGMTPPWRTEKWRGS